MPVYVDPLFDWPGPHEMSRWCHMRADSLDELHAMADRLGMRREWFQDKPGKPHYDLIPSHREAAILYGAIELTRREWVQRFSKRLISRSG